MKEVECLVDERNAKIMVSFIHELGDLDERSITLCQGFN